MKRGKTPARWITTAAKIVADCRVFLVSQQSSRNEENGRSRNWYVINTNDFVNVVAITTENELVLVRQFRHGSEEFSLELPGGMVDDGEEPLEAGVRELLEETGFAGENAQVYASCNPNPAIMNNTCHFVLIQDVVHRSEVSWDENEEMEIELMPMDKVKEACRRGEFMHSLTLAALMRYFVAE
ncbi:MAG: NUDIX hydrolase [Verrucomicrobiota bacterium]